ncbi:putative membrane channel-forming protein YqfA (hemolysin III family) [Sporomusaceae bacterium BoRhaA]|uniref:hypothetical protein n=1 Tax=Pelorhabdus rhamnosifermentans TaxID=2772457 RepID=UPI001C05F178|nr:hypothetical protein [Pelorhabdus rhamnosifermentans]MBU2700581.1 putative membrane channel-forming protein YqfA (hemolysin III family) [Pelorhabdus rhamnosifermentans]
MTGTFLGLNLKYLPWQLVVPIMLGLSIFCAYGALTIRGKGKNANIFFFCLAIASFISGIKTMATHTGIFLNYLSLLDPIMYVFGGIVMIIVFWKS